MNVGELTIVPVAAFVLTSYQLLPEPEYDNTLLASYHATNPFCGIGELGDVDGVNVGVTDGVGATPEPVGVIVGVGVDVLVGVTDGVGAGPEVFSTFIISAPHMFPFLAFSDKGFSKSSILIFGLLLEPTGFQFLLPHLYAI